MRELSRELDRLVERTRPSLERAERPVELIPVSAQGCFGWLMVGTAKRAPWFPQLSFTAKTLSNTGLPNPQSLRLNPSTLSAELRKPKPPNNTPGSFAKAHGAQAPAKRVVFHRASSGFRVLGFGV